MVVIILPTLQSGGTEWQTYKLVASLTRYYKVHLWVYDCGHVDQRIRDAFAVLEQVSISFGVVVGLRRMVLLRPKIILSYAINYYLPEIALRLLTGASLITERRNLYHWLKTQNRRRWQELIRNQLTCFVVCNSTAVADVVSILEPDVADRLSIIYNSIEPIKRVPTQRSKIVAVGNIKPGKGIEDSMAIFQALETQAAKHGLGFAVYGRCDDATLMAGLDPAFVKRVYRGQMNKEQIFSDAFCLVHLSKAEGFPNAVLEAISFGVVPILSDIAPHRELFSECAVLVDSAESALQAVKRALEWHGNTDSEFSFLREKCLSKAAEFSVSRRVQSYKELFNACIN